MLHTEGLGQMHMVTCRVWVYEKKIFFFPKFRHNRHFFRQTGRKFFIVEKLSFNLWSQFHTGSTPDYKLCTSMWELWRNDWFSAFFSKLDASYLHTYDELVENFLHVRSPQLLCFTQKVWAKCLWLLAGLWGKTAKRGQITESSRHNSPTKLARMI